MSGSIKFSRKFFPEKIYKKLKTFYGAKTLYGLKSISLVNKE